MNSKDHTLLLTMLCMNPISGLLLLAQLFLAAASLVHVNETNGRTGSLLQAGDIFVTAANGSSKHLEKFQTKNSLSEKNDVKHAEGLALVTSNSIRVVEDDMKLKENLDNRGTFLSMNISISTGMGQTGSLAASTTPSGQAGVEDSVPTMKTRETTTSVNDRHDERLEVIAVSPNERLVQPYNLVPGGLVPYLADLRGQVDVPLGQFAVISVKKTGTNLLRDCDRVKTFSYWNLEIYGGSVSKGDRLLENRYDETLFPLIVNTSVVHVRFCCGIAQGCHLHMMPLRITFHQTGSLPPERLSDTQWNCSVPDWQHYRNHFACDLDVQCVSGKDEVGCPHSGCGLGNISVSGSCFYFLPWTDPDWGKARQKCRETGGDLAMLQTVAEWSVVSRALRDWRLGLRRIPFGITTTSSAMPSIYGYLGMWIDNTVAYSSSYVMDVDSLRYLCGTFDERFNTQLIQINSQCRGINGLRMQPLCEVESTKEHMQTFRIEVVRPQNQNFSLSVLACRKGHVTLPFLPCQSSSLQEYLSDNVTATKKPVQEELPSFTCNNGVQQVPYTLLCDHRQECSDNSDEAFCQFQPCSGSTPTQCGTSNQCIRQDQVCDGQSDCFNRMDHLGCVNYVYERDPIGLYSALPPPALVHLDPTSESGISVTMTPLPTNPDGVPYCPETHFQCPGDGYCLPVFVRCNGVTDCPNGEDEKDCVSYTCPGLYRCRGSTICLHALHVCDGLKQCPLYDDELYCHLTCPKNCTCNGLAFRCPRDFAVYDFTDLRYLDAMESGLTLLNLTQNLMLVHVSLARCGLSELAAVTLPNLRGLDLSDNNIRNITTTDLTFFPNLRELSLAGNPLIGLLSVDSNVSLRFPFLLSSLDFSRIFMREFETDVLKIFPDLSFLNLSHNGIQRVTGTFRALNMLKVLDIRGCPLIYFQKDVLKDQERLQQSYADNYKLCCPATLPADFSLNSCRAPFDEVSSCESLLRSDLYRVALAVFSAFSVLGNLGSFFARIFVWKTGSKSGFGVFVFHLCVSDFVMGVYLAIIGLADHLYRGIYLWEDIYWRNSAACKVAGFLSLLSSEVSAFIVCFITLDRFLVLRFPLSGLHFSNKTAHVTCAVTWLVGMMLAAVPLLPLTQHWEFYSQTGICIPLPITRTGFAGRTYSFGIMIVLNFVLFLLIAAGQIFIYSSIRANRMSLGTDSVRKDQDVNIARRLITIAVSDFLCWFPIGLLGLLASGDVPIPGELNVAMAILVLPLNSALNPFLYNLNMVLERRRKAKEQQLFKALESHVLL